jgi:hypothetical protein
LAETYPTPRKKEEVPVWIYLSSELSLQLHGQTIEILEPTPSN